MLTTSTRAITVARGPVIMMSAALIAASAGSAQILVDSTKNFTSAGVFASGGETYKLAAKGSVDLAAPNGYQTDPNGTIVRAPAAGSGAYQFFQSSALPLGTAPAVGRRKLTVSDALLPYAPHGALVVGYAMSFEEFEARRYPPLYVAYKGLGTVIPPPAAPGASLVFGVNSASPFTISGAYTAIASGDSGSVRWDVGGTGALPPTLPTVHSLTATGEVDIASNGGSYKTTPDGVITAAPAAGSQARTFFSNSAGPVGEAPSVGQSKMVIPRHPMPGAPYGALVAGWSKTANPSTYGDFPRGFEFVGTGHTITAPEGGGFLFFAVNDFFTTTTTDNAGSFEVTVAASVPEISSVVMLSAFGGDVTVAPGGFVEIYGSSLSTETRTWSGDDFENGVAPRSLADVKVLFGDRQAFVHYVSPNQVNCVVPDGLAPGDVYVTVSDGEKTSSAFRVAVAERAPSLLAPPSFRTGGRQHVVGILEDGAFAGPRANLDGVRYRPAKAGDRVVFYGIGFGQSDPPVAAGAIARGLTTLPNVEVKFGDVPVLVEYAGFAPDSVALYQFNVVVPPGVTGDARVAMSVEGIAVPQELWIRLE